MLIKVLKLCLEKGGSDVHIGQGRPPCIRVDGVLKKIQGEILTAEDSKNLIYSVMTEEQRSAFEERKNLDFSFGVRGMSRFRANIYYQKGTVAACFRRVEEYIPSMAEANITILSHLLNSLNGLILVTGPTGSGKTTTIASMINHINENYPVHIISLEDPIEYIFPHKMGAVSQREIGSDVADFESGLRYMLRQDPDVCYIGELRDLDSIEMALRLSQTGHLVFATLHTNSAVETIVRIVNVFEGDKRAAILNSLSFSLTAVISQRLLKKKGGKGRHPSLEILRINSNIKNLIRTDKIHQIYGMMQSGQAETGMQTQAQSLASLVKQGTVSEEEAYANCEHIKELSHLLGYSKGEK